MTPAESLDLYDVEVQYQHFTSTDFKKQAPGKVTYGLTEALLKARRVLSKKREVEDNGRDVSASKKARVTQILIEKEPQSENVKEDQTVNSAKATKSDDAEVQVDIWNRRMFQKCLSVLYQADKHAKMCDMLRRAMLRFYQWKIYTSFRKYLHQKYGGLCEDENTR
ncbi:predicted protein [Chaetoceros tenuissimus]|uniref:Uncharacterized protein n=1 Tax=Chaetoceros tenuissimus TaxID=426638 RepID=A0AAD3H5H1_9STRA|nr:predicted protein [Chaetoceros tenuissimus]